MRHRPFEDWILQDEPLDRADRFALENHLRDCNRCAALARHWTQAKRVLISPLPDLGLPLGFSRRLADRLHKEFRQPKRILRPVGFITATGSLLLASLVILTLLFQSNALSSAIEAASRSGELIYDLSNRLEYSSLLLAGQAFAEIPVLGMAFFAVSGAIGILVLKAYRLLTGSAYFS